MTSAKASVISACGWRWGGSAPAYGDDLHGRLLSLRSRPATRPPASPTASPRRDPSVAQPELDERVEAPPVAGRGGDAGVDHRGPAAQPGGHPGVVEVPVEQSTHGAPVPGPRRLRRAAGECVRRGATGQGAGGHRVVDALAGHRVDQPGGVTGEQHAAVGLVVAPPPARQRQVVAAPAGAAVGRSGQQPGSAGRGAGRAWEPRAAPAGRPARRTRRWTSRRRGRRPRRTTAAAARRSG